MSSSIADRLDALRGESATLLALSASERGERVGTLLDAWSTETSVWREALSEALPRVTGFSNEMVCEGSRRGFAPYTAEALRSLVQTEQPRPVSDPSVCVTILAGAIPMPTLVAVAAPLVLGSAVVLKPSAADPASPVLVARSAREIDSLLGRCVEVVPLPPDDPKGKALNALLRADTVVVTGSDDSVAQISHSAPQGSRVIEHGHRFSATIVGAEATAGRMLEVTSRAIAEDVALWDQLGCLSPIGVWVVDRDPSACDRVTDALSRALSDVERRWPRGRLNTGERARFRDAVDTDAMRSAGDPGLRVIGGDTWCVVREREPSLRTVPLYRYLRVYPAPTLEVACAAIDADRAHLAALAVAGLQDGEISQLSALRPSRICPVGTLQTPPLDWRRDHLDVIASLGAKADCP